MSIVDYDITENLNFDYVKSMDEKMNLSLHLIKYLVYFRETCILTFLLGGINCSKSTRTMPSGEVGTYTFLNIIEY